MSAPIGSHEKHIILIPTWVRDVVKRHNFDAVDVLAYSKIRQAINVSECALFWAAQEHLAPILGLGACDYLLKSWEQSCSNDEQKIELASSVSALAKTPAVVSDLEERLKSGFNPDPTPWQITDLSRQVVAIYVAPGFTNSLSDPAVEITFLREIVEKLHSWQTDEMVSQTKAFKRYVCALDTVA